MPITVSNEGITDEIYNVLMKLIGSHAALIAKAFGANTLDVTRTNDSICFPWFRHPSDDEEQNAYYDFINRLIDKVKTTKIVYEPVSGNNDEKYVFSKFLYRLGIDGNGFRKTRAVLMRNLDGAIWKNLTYKKRKTQRDIAKEA
ncbi:hypothetical protein AGMMS49992_28190 [Clostridia bacterium]|nr:hypothetical protein AGMMS49992_28190 [Clostridia bacterium]